MSKYFVTGASGMLGTTLYDLFTKNGHEVISTDLNPLDPWTKQLDVRDITSVQNMIEECRPDWVLNLAALTDVEYCESNPQEAFNTNATGAINVAKTCAKLNLHMVHISTAGVFDGTRPTPYTEEDIPRPVNYYGKSKYEAEQGIAQILNKYYIFRAGWMMGSGDRDKKFIRKVLKQFDEGRTLYGVTDMFGCPTYVLDFATGILKMTTDSKDFGMYNMVSEGECSRYDVLCKIIEVLGLDSVDAVPVKGNVKTFGAYNFYAPRPPYEVIVNKKLHDRDLFFMPQWDDAVTRYLKLHYYDKYSDARRRDVYEKRVQLVVKENKPLVSIVTTAYKNEKFNEKYFESINNQTYKNIEVIFVDNLSPDDTVEGAKKLIKNGKIIISKINTGCAGGNNVGVLEANGKYIFLMGPDAWADNTCIELLVKEAEKRDYLIYCPRQMTYDGNEFISCGIAADLFGYPARTYTKDGLIQTKRAFYADGSGVFISKKNYLKVGMMDEETFLFAEDVDLSWKGHLIGLEVIPVKESVIYHFSGGSVGIGGFPKDKKYETFGKRRFFAERNIIRNIIKNYRWWNVLWVLTYYILINMAEILSLIFTRQFKAIFETYVKAYVWNIKNIKDTLIKRRKIQHIRTVSDLEVMKKMSFFPHKFLALLELGIPKVN